MIRLGGSDERAAEDCDLDRPGCGAISGKPANGSSSQKNAMANVRAMKKTRGTVCAIAVEIRRMYKFLAGCFGPRVVEN